MIRQFDASDLPDARETHAANGLPENCFPNLIIKDAQGREADNPLFIVKAVYEVDGKVAMSCFLKVVSELFLLVDHSVGTPEQRWEWLKEFKDHMQREAWKRGLEEMTAFIPPEIEESFGKRLVEMGFVKSVWPSYTLPVDR